MSPTNQRNWKNMVNNANGDQSYIDAISLVTANGVEYTLTSAVPVGAPDDTLKDLENWAYAISYAIHLADKVKDEPLMGWLLKRGEKGHHIRNTKRRWCQLQGSKLRYFTQTPHNNKITHLKGIIDLAHLSEICDKMLTQIRGREVIVLGEPAGHMDCFGGGGARDSIDMTPPVDPQQPAAESRTAEELKTVVGISLLINNEREFVLLFESQDDRIKWVNAITSAVERTYSSLQVTIATSRIVHSPDKQVILGGWMRKTKVNKWWDKRYCTLTPTSLIYYKEDPPQKPLGSINLLVSSCRIIKSKTLDGLDWCFSLADSRGLEYFFNLDTQDQMDRWIKEIKMVRKRMIVTLLDQGGKIVIPIVIGKDCALITIQVKEVIRINSLSNKIAYEIPVSNTKTVSVTPDNKLEIVYVPIDGEVPEKKIEILSSNPHGVLQLFKDLFSSQENTIN
ncbi:hypothetical protein SAMD00019534_084490 [Acytostelium subglobosum LB1]|uniref:hypothetical protein n=1 Tax=Acytostelium subglobosum LB1 TaxID=1410327 RepID=UPI000644CF8E|nr:hypothetical protein SAMD00019534_084490 [Acytostelium subglobosum LB1]GAM25274.1 hypothetical protein SAMD00019534_084490 [Acytostelium subglobosum LB1]|eukprot:XP_012751794.1 hypothetical protein SAMD00019534_084490 [Acytostelium subglobosum LB1]